MKKKSKLRIIGGQLGSRTLFFEEVDGLRPTLNRVRETLFNWLQAKIISANCLDLYAGSGALGFEAFSRGAKKVTMIEKHPKVVYQLQSNIKQLGLNNLVVKEASAQQFINHCKQGFDIIFVDPPFTMVGLEDIPIKLEQSNLMQSNTLVYLECSSKQNYQLPKNWQVLKKKKVGDVQFQLVSRLNESQNEEI